MKKEIIITEDGSHTVSIPEMNVTYHSEHGAIQESMHVFIEAGFRYWCGCNPERPRPDPINIFEMGFGTGLNAFLTSIEAATKKAKVYYAAIEQFPLSTKEVMSLNYPETLKHKEWFKALHACEWNADTPINDYFTLRKIHENLLNFSTKALSEAEGFDIIYYDAFAPNAQPELWTMEIFKKLYSMLLPGGVLVTYCSKGDVRRAMQSAGFIVQKIPGPLGKREMVRAVAHSDPADAGPSAHEPNCLTSYFSLKLACAQRSPPFGRI